MKTNYLTLKSIAILFTGIIMSLQTLAQPANRPLLISQNLSNVCPASTANLNSALVDNPSSGQTIRWFTNNIHSGLEISNPETAAAGTYYAFLYDSVGGTYSEASNPLTVTTNSCSGLNSGNIPCNQLIPLNNTYFSGLAGHRSKTGLINLEFGTLANLTDADLTNSISNNITGIGASATYSVKHPTDTYPAGTYAGFKVSSSGLLSVSLGFTLSVEVYNDSVLVHSENVVTSSVGLNTALVDGDGNAVVGFLSPGNFDEIRVKFTSLLGVLATSRAYYAVIGNYCAGPSLQANVLTPTNNNLFPMVVSNERTGLLCVGCSVSNLENMVSQSTTDFATLTLGASIGASSTVAVKDVKTTYPSGIYAAFSISNPSLLKVSALGAFKVRTLLNGTPQDSLTGTSLIALNSGLLGASDKKTLGLISSKSFNEVQLIASNPVAAVNNIQIYGLALQTFQDQNLDNCNNFTELTTPEYPLYINGERTGVFGGDLGTCVLCNIQGEANVINNLENDFATINLGVSVLNVTGALAVKRGIGTFNSGTFAGFEIENTSILDLSVLNAISLKTYLNNMLVDSESGSSLIANVLGSSSKKTLGIVSSGAFDEVVIELNNNLLSASLGNTKIHSFIATEFCSPTLVCDSVYKLNQPDFPVIINEFKSGTSGVACVGAQVLNSGNLINADTTDYANISIPVGVACQAAITVKSYGLDFPGGSTAGFILQDINNIAQADLLESIEVVTYKNGMIVDSIANSSLLNLELLGLIGGSAKYELSFRTSGAYDEIKIKAFSLASVLQNLRVYGVFVNTRGSNDVSLTCCAASGTKPELISFEDVNECPEEFLRLNSIIKVGCPVGTNLEWHTVQNGFTAASKVAKPDSVFSGSFFAVCYDPIIDCYGTASDSLITEVIPCCPTLVLGDTLNPTTCSGSNGSIKFCGLKASTSGYTVKYAKYGLPLVSLTDISSDVDGCITIDGLSAGVYDNISISSIDCPLGSNSLTATLTSPNAPDSPTLLTSSSGSSICLGSSTTLTANCSTGNLVWYSDNTLSTLLPSNMVTPLSDATYYAVCELVNCKSGAESINIEVKTIPSPPISLTASPNVICQGQSSTLSGLCASGSVSWYADSNLNVPSGTTVSPGSNATYYAVCSENTCTSSAGSATITVNPSLPAPTLTATPATIDIGQQSVLGGSCSSGSLSWYADSTLNTPLLLTTVSPVVTSTYYANCGSACAIKAAVTVVVKIDTFDVSLSINRAVGQKAVVKRGEFVHLTQTVVNEGNMPASNVLIVAYIPSGLILDDPNWTSITPILTVLTNPIANVPAQQTYTVNLRLKVDSLASGTLMLATEISVVSGGIDIDSTPDSNPLNDILSSSGARMRAAAALTEDDYSQLFLEVCPGGNCATATIRRIK